MKCLTSILSGLFVLGVAGCNMEMYPQPYRSPVILSAEVAAHVYLVTPLSRSRYSVEYIPGVVTERAIVASFAPRCREIGRSAFRAAGPTRHRIVRHHRWRRSRAVNVFTVICR